MKKTIGILLLFCLLASLTACTGWRLRGSDSGTNIQENSIYLSGSPSETYQLIVTQLTRKNALTSFETAQLQLIVNNEQWKRRSASVTSNTSTAEFELTLTVNYSILDAQQVELRAPTDVRISRSYTFDENDIAGKDKEEKIVRRDIQRAVARQILQQLQLLQR